MRYSIKTKEGVDSFLDNLTPKVYCAFCRINFERKRCGAHICSLKHKENFANNRDPLLLTVSEIAICWRKALQVKKEEKTKEREELTLEFQGIFAQLEEERLRQ